MREIIHFIKHVYGTLNDRIGTKGACTLAKSETEIQKRFCVHGIKHEFMTALVTTMAENGIVNHVLVEL